MLNILHVNAVFAIDPRVSASAQVFALLGPAARIGIT
jgi:hypothetical protein